MGGPELKIYEHSPTYEEVKDFIGGWLEAIELSNGDLMLMDEEGKIKGLSANSKATAIWNFNFGPTDVICGNVAIIPKAKRDPEMW